MSARLQERQVERHTLPLPDGVALLNTTKIVLQVSDRIAPDFGALCYLRREKTRSSPYAGRKVDPDSLCPKRTAQIARLLAWVAEQYNGGLWRPATFGNYIREFVKFVDWCDSSGHHAALATKDDAHRALRAWVQHLRDQVATGKATNNGATVQQSGAIRVLKDFFNANDITRGINLLRSKDDHISPTAVPSDDKVGRLIGVCSALFNGVCDLTLNFKPYPYALSVPSFLQWPEDTLWLFGLKRWRITPDEDVSDTEHIPPFIDYAGGRVLDVEAFVDRYVSAYTARKAYADVATEIAEANADRYHRHRLRLAAWAAAAFYVIFISATGMNGAQAIELPWSDDLLDPRNIIEPHRQNFRAVKYRAGGREVSFIISARTVPLFLKYLELRKFLLRGRGFGYLFVDLLYRQGAADIASVAPRAPRNTFEYSFNILLSKLTPKVPRVTPRELRSAKQDFMIRKYDPVTTSIMLQHSLRTTFRKYSQGSEVQAQKEMGEFLTRMEDTVLQKGVNPPGSTSLAVGACLDEGHPHARVENPPAVPDCKRQEGCLFCGQYRVHADETDVRKLLSLHYCLRRTAHFAKSAEEHDALFGPILQRIDSLLLEIGKRAPSMLATVERVRTEVDVRGVLDPYWAGKLEFLMSLEELL